MWHFFQKLKNLTNEIITALRKVEAIDCESLTRFIWRIHKDWLQFLSQIIWFSIFFVQLIQFFIFFFERYLFFSEMLLWFFCPIFLPYCRTFNRYLFQFFSFSSCSVIDWNDYIDFELDWIFFLLFLTNFIIFQSTFVVRILQIFVRTIYFLQITNNYLNFFFFFFFSRILYICIQFLLFEFESAIFDSNYVEDEPYIVSIPLTSFIIHYFIILLFSSHFAGTSYQNWFLKIKTKS